MKTTCLYFTCFLLTSINGTTTASQHTEHHKFGVHGMLLFGHAEQLYISHLPLFNHPHDQQVIAEISIVGLSDRDWLKAQHASEILTLVPQPFDLSQIDQPNFSFKANLYIGHFERGGELHVEGLSVRISKLIINRPLNDLSVQSNFSYQLIQPTTNAQIQYYYRLIDSQPAADHIVAVHTKQTLPDQLSFRSNELFSSPKAIANKLLIKTEHVSSVYLETNELR